jgi:large subunit ribosomal protein L15
MLKLSELKPYKHATQRRKVVGRGVGSGHGTYSGRGAKGQKARSGSSIPVGFEGGRMPLHRQLPKRRGFKSMIAKDQVVNLSSLHKKFKANETVNPKTLLNKGLIKDSSGTVKILSKGELKVALSFEGVEVSANTRAKIEKAGGKIAENKQN